MIRHYLLISLLTIASQICISQKSGSLKDTRDGKIYKTTKIGEQEWMAENLATTKFRNGDIIPEVKSVEEWRAAITNKRAAWCYNLTGEKENNKLYNIWAVLDPRGLAPEGWRIPYNEDVNKIYNYYLEKEKDSIRKATAASAQKELPKDTLKKNNEEEDDDDAKVFEMPKSEYELDPTHAVDVRAKVSPKLRAIGWGDGTNESGFNAINFQETDVNGKGIFPGTYWWAQLYNDDLQYISLREGGVLRTVVLSNFYKAKEIERYYGLSVRCIKE